MIHNKKLHVNVIYKIQIIILKALINDWRLNITPKVIAYKNNNYV